MFSLTGTLVYLMGRVGHAAVIILSCPLLSCHVLSSPPYDCCVQNLTAPAPKRHDIQERERMLNRSNGVSWILTARVCVKKCCSRKELHDAVSWGTG